MALLSPNRWKYRKQFRGRLKWRAMRWNRVAFGDFGMKAVTGWYLTNRQLEAARKVIVRVTRKVWKIPWKMIFEISWVDKATAEKVLKLAAHKLPLKITVVERGEIK